MLRAVSMLFVTLPVAAVLLPLPMHPAPQDTKHARTGRITAWSVRGDGTVALKLDGREPVEGKDQEQPFALWYVTPADKTESTRFEHLTLAALLNMVATDQDITIASDKGNDKNGKTLGNAIPMYAILWGTSWKDATALAEGK